MDSFFSFIFQIEPYALIAILAVSVCGMVASIYVQIHGGSDMK